MTYVPLGKFDCALHDLLYTLTASFDWAADHEGQTEDFGCYAWVMTLDRESMTDENLADVAREAALVDPDDATLVDAVYGHWIVSTDSQGFVYVTEFPDEEQLDTAWQAFKDSYAQWAEENPND